MPRADVRAVRWTVILMAGASLAACASVTPQPRYPSRLSDVGKAPTTKGPSGYKTGEPYQVGGIWYVPHEQPDYDETGVASWYGQAFNQKATADGEVFDMYGVSGAHTTLPLPSMVEVTNLENGRKLVVRVNDRGPFVGGRIIDLSYGAAQQLGYAEKGLAKVRVRYVGPAPLAGPEAGVRVADASPRSPARGGDGRMAPPAWGFHKPLATRLPAGASVQLASTVARPVAAAPAAVGHAAAAPAVADDLVPNAYKAPDPVGVTTLASLPSAPAAPPRPAASSPAARSARHAPLTGAELGPPRGERIALPVFDPPSSAQGAARGFRIQAGAFSSEDNAQRAVERLASAGQASVEPFEKDGVTLYRVYVPGAADEVAAYAIRDKVAAAGFADARVVSARPGA